MGLNRLDLALVAVYLIGITLFGLRFRKKQRTLRDRAGHSQFLWWCNLSIEASIKPPNVGGGFDQ